MNTMTINGIELPAYENTRYVNLSYAGKERIERYIAEGWEECNGDFYSKTELEPMYHAQCKDIKSMGQEPRYANYSVHTHQTETYYFGVSKEEYEKMAVKPELTDQCRPVRFHNFDGFTEKIQEEVNCKGWEEIDEVHYHLTRRRIFFVLN